MYDHVYALNTAPVPQHDVLTVLQALFALHGEVKCVLIFSSY